MRTKGGKPTKVSTLLTMLKRLLKTARNLTLDDVRDEAEPSRLALRCHAVADRLVVFRIPPQSSRSVPLLGVQSPAPTRFDDRDNERSRVCRLVRTGRLRPMG